jgi:hypothetical protein
MPHNIKYQCNKRLIPGNVTVSELQMSPKTPQCKTKSGSRNTPTSVAVNLLMGQPYPKKKKLSLTDN